MLKNPCKNFTGYPAPSPGNNLPVSYLPGERVFRGQSRPPGVHVFLDRNRDEAFMNKNGIRFGRYDKGLPFVRVNIGQAALQVIAESHIGWLPKLRGDSRPGVRVLISQDDACIGHHPVLQHQGVVLPGDRGGIQQGFEPVFRHRAHGFAQSGDHLCPGGDTRKDPCRARCHGHR